MLLLSKKSIHVQFHLFLDRPRNLVHSLVCKHGSTATNPPDAIKAIVQVVDNGCEQVAEAP